MYTHCTKAIQDKEVSVHDFQTYQQLASIVGSTLKAPEYEHDDRATSFALGQCARLIPLGGDVAMVSASVTGRGQMPEQGNFEPEAVGASSAVTLKTRSPFVRTTRVIRTSTRATNATQSDLG